LSRRRYWQRRRRQRQRLVRHRLVRHRLGELVMRLGGDLVKELVRLVVLLSDFCVPSQDVTNQWLGKI
jgi:hypothetical protein